MRARFAFLLLLILSSFTLRAQDAWVSVPQDATTANLWSVAYGNNVLIAVGEQGTILHYDYANPAWVGAVSGSMAWLVGVGYGNGRYIVVGENGTILTSDDTGVTWTARTSRTTNRLNAVAYGEGIWLAVGESGTVLTSNDGTTWTVRSALGTGFLRALAYGQGQFLLGGAGGSLYRTTDGVAFSKVDLGVTSDVEGIAMSAEQIWAVGSGGFLASSVDGTSWTLPTEVYTLPTFRGVAVRGNRQAVAVADWGSQLWRDGAWSTVSRAQMFLATAVVQGKGEVIAVGFHGGLARMGVNSAPVIVSGSITRARYGSDVQLAATDDAATGSRYQWYRGDVAISGATNLTLTLASETEGRYFMLKTTRADGSTASASTYLLLASGGPEVRDSGFVSALPILPYLVVPQADGKILVAGYFSVSIGGTTSVGLARLNGDGSLDM